MKALFTPLLWLVVTGCGTQYSDPIREVAPPPDPLTCVRENVLQFDGAQFGTMARLVQDDFSIEVWLKTDSSLMGDLPYVGNPVVYADVPATTTDDFGAGLIDGKFRMTIGNPDTPVRSTSNVTTDQWVHVAATRTRATGIVLVYVNGLLEGVGIGNTHTLAASDTMSIGGRAGRDFYVGLMSDLRIWKTIRSQAEIAENMHHRLSGREPGLVGYYRFDDAPSAVAHDSSPSQNDATFDAVIDRAASDPPVCAQ